MSERKRRAPASKKQPHAAKQSVSSDSFQLELTRQQLVHLRDLFGVLLNFDSTETLSESLAAAMGTSLQERKLWHKVVDACGVASIPMGDGAPDFALIMSRPPQLTVTLVGEDDAELEQER